MNRVPLHLACGMYPADFLFDLFHFFISCLYLYLYFFLSVLPTLTSFVDALWCKFSRTYGSLFSFGELWSVKTYRSVAVGRETKSQLRSWKPKLASSSAVYVLEAISLLPKWFAYWKVMQSFSDSLPVFFSFRACTCSCKRERQRACLVPVPSYIVRCCAGVLMFGVFQENFGEKTRSWGPLMQSLCKYWRLFSLLLDLQMFGTRSTCIDWDYWLFNFKWMQSCPWNAWHSNVQENKCM